MTISPMNSTFTVDPEGVSLKGDDDGLDIEILFDGEKVFHTVIPPGYTWRGVIGGNGLLQRADGVSDGPVSSSDGQ